MCPGRIVPRCIYFVYFALVVWLDMQVIISDCFVVHVRMNIYLLYVHWSHSLMTVLVWSSVCLHDIYCLHTWSHFTCYIIFVLLSLDLPWGSNVFWASVSSYGYICSKFITTPMIHDRGSDMRKRERALCYINYVCFVHSSCLCLAI